MNYSNLLPGAEERAPEHKAHSRRAAGDPKAHAGAWLRWANSWLDLHPGDSRHPLALGRTCGS